MATRNTQDPRINAVKADRARRAQIKEDIRIGVSESYLDPAHDGKRKLAGFVATMISLTASAYQTSVLTVYVFTGAAVMSGSAFIAWCAATLVVAICVYLALLASSQVGEYIATGRLELDLRRAKNWVGGLFSSDKAVAE